MKYHIQLTRDGLRGQYPEPILWEGIYRVNGRTVIRPVTFLSKASAQREADRINRSRGAGSAVVVEAE